MSAKKYNDEKRRVFTTGGYLAIIIAIVVIAALVAITLLVVLPSTEEIESTTPKIVSISYEDGEIGINSDLNKVYVTVTYSDGKTDRVSLGSIVSSGLDITTSGEQNVSISYGGFEQTISVKVKDIRCTVTYTASVGGRIHGTTKQVIPSGSDASTVIAVPETGYTFVGWSDGYAYATRKDTGVNENRAYMARFEKAHFRVIFFYNDGTVASEEDVLYGEAATKMPQLTDPRMSVYGYEFMGWSVGELDYKNVYRNLNIYPSYVKNATDVTVDVKKDSESKSMGETDANTFGYYARNKVATIIATPYNSRQFNRWEILSSNKTYVVVGINETKEIEIGDGHNLVSFSCTRSGNSTTQYALSFTPTAAIDEIYINCVFVYEKSSVKFINYQNSAIGNQEAEIDGIEYGVTLGSYLSQYPDSVSATISPVTGILEPKEVIGMTFIGWYVRGDNTQTIINREQIFEEPTVLIAKWSRQTYQIKFKYVDEGGQEQLFSTISVLFQGTIGSGGGVPLSVPTKQHYIFVGWIDELTRYSIDDSYQIVAQREYLDSGDFTDNKTINIIASWKLIEHKLKADIEGSGTVSLSHTENGRLINETVSGDITLFEIYTYDLVFNANLGNKIEYIDWTYGKFESVVSSDDNSYTQYQVTLNSMFDNEIRCIFSPQVFDVEIYNGDGNYCGYVKYNDGTMYFNDVIRLSINYGNNIKLDIISYIVMYEIDNIVIDGNINGTTYVETNKYANLEEMGITNYTLLLNNINSNVKIVIEYKARQTEISLNLPNSSAVEVYNYDFESEETTSAENTLVSNYDDNVFYSIEAAEGKYLSNIVIDGIQYELFSAYSDVVFFDWQINGVDLGIEFIRIGDEYYYYYGAKVIDGIEYRYCQDLTGKVRIFIYDEDLETYEELIVASNAYTTESNFINLSNDLADYLNIEERSIFGSVLYDKRVTSVKVKIITKKNLSIGINYDNIKYNVSIENSLVGSSTISNTTVGYNGTSTVTFTPVSGYYIDSYILNDQNVKVSGYADGKTYKYTFSNIKEDKIIVPVYKKITYNVVFINNTANEYNAYVSKDSGTNNILATSYSYALEFAASAKFKLTVEDGVRISYLKIDDEEIYITKNMTFYEYENLYIVKGVRIVCKCDALEENEATSTYTFNSNATNYRISYDYTGVTNEVEILAKEGHKLTSINFVGNGGNKIVKINLDSNTDTYSLVNAEDTTVSKIGTSEYRTALKVNLNKGLFDEGTIVNVSVETETEEVNINLDYDSSKGTVSSETTVKYGKNVTIAINAKSNYYVKNLTINGASISFGNGKWNNLVYESSIKQYTGGEFTYVVSSDQLIEVEFSIYEYTVMLDSASVNGTTTFISDSGIGETVRVEYGKTFSISMEAYEGYHIESIYINGQKSSYSAYQDAINSNITATYEYPGMVTGNISIRVLYEVNKYGFYYSLENQSINFASDTNFGSISTEYNQSKDSYYSGIPHGVNFSINISPNVSDGYYLYSVSITYQGYGDFVKTTVTRKIDDAEPYLERLGGVIWFNRFMFGNNTERYTGLTADIENINIVFKKNLNLVTVVQESSLESGTVSLNVTNQTNYSAYVVLVDSDTNVNANRYYFNPANNKFYILNTMSEYELIDIQYVLDGDTWKYKFEDNEIPLYMEFGLRLNVIVTPTIGYYRSKFEVNNINRENLVASNRYGVGITNAINAVVEYKKIVHRITFSTICYSSTMSRISQNNLADYVGVVFKNLTTGQDYVIGASTVIEGIEYGTRYQIIISPNFAEHGVYISSFKNETNQVVNLNQDSSLEYTYGTNEGYEVINNLSFSTVCMIRQYDIKLKTEYFEDIKNETINYITAENESSDSFKMYWNSTINVTITPGKGYYIRSVAISYGEIERNVYIVGLDQNTFMFDLSGVVNLGEIKEDGHIEFSIEGLKQNITLSAIFAREDYTLLYTFEENTNEFLQSISTTINRDINKFPTIVSSELQIPTHYYDELFGIITPKDGYKVVGAYVTIESVVFNADTGEWDNLTNNGVDIKTNIDLRATGNNDEMAFNCHVGNIAEYVITSSVRIKLKLEIKQYNFNTTVTRTDAKFDTTTGKNDTVVAIKIRRENGSDYVTSPDGTVSDENMTRDSGINLLKVVEHHGTISFDFVAPSGYYLSSMSLNGFNIEDLKDDTKDFYYVFNESRRVSNGTVYYYYKVVVKITTTLLKGSLVNYWTAGENDFQANIVISPISYGIKVVINNELCEFDSSSGNNIAVDSNNKLTISSLREVSHFDTLNVNATVSEGYEITSKSMYYGTVNSMNDQLIGFNPNETLRNGVLRLEYQFSSINTVNTNILEGITYAYLVFEVDIIRYEQSLETVVTYTNPDTHLIVNEEALTAGHNAATITTTASKAAVSGGDSFNYSYIDNFEYFTRLTITAQAKAGYDIYAIYEIDVLTSEKIRITNSTNTLTLIVNQVGNEKIYRLEYTVNSLGQRKFLFDVRQKTTVSLYVENPYKYVRGNNNYLYYTTIRAYENGNLIEPSNRVSTRVQDVYNYTVYVGNNLSYQYISAYSTNLDHSTYSSVNFYNQDVGQYVDDYITDNGLVKGNTVDNLKNEISGLRTYPELIYNLNNPTGGYAIVGGENFYLYSNIYGQVSGSKTTIGGLSKVVGGSIIYNNNSTETSNNILYSTDTVSNSIVTIKVVPEDGYDFYRLTTRQIDVTKSKQAGYVVYKTTNTSLISLTFEGENDLSTVKAFNENCHTYNGTHITDGNGFRVVGFEKANDNKSYYIYLYVIGNIKFNVEFYKTYSFSAAVYKSDYITQLGDAGLDYTNIKISEYEDVMYGNHPDSTDLYDSVTGDIEYEKVSYNARFNISVYDKITNDLANYSKYQFVGWYINNLNTFTALTSLFPTNDYLETDITISIDEISTLVADGEETAEISLLAVFIPKIDVTILNENYYASTTHFNSWNNGTIGFEYYPYYSNQGVVLSPETKLLFNNNPKQLNELNAYIENSQLNTKYGLTNWSVAYNDAKVDKSSSTSVIYTEYFDFSILYENVVNGNYSKYSWEESVIPLYTLAMPNDATFSAWQYFNWNTNKWTNIQYTYNSSSTGYTTSRSESYDFMLKSLYLIDPASGVSYVPYAISSTDANNFDIDRPLLIRADIYKTVEVKLTQNYFIDKLDANIDYDSADWYELSRFVVSNSAINSIEITNAADVSHDEISVADRTTRAFIDDGDPTIGQFEYGSVITINNNVEEDNGIVGSTTKYRFLGWAVVITIEDNGSVSKVIRFIDGYNEDAVDYNYGLICQETRNDTEVSLMALYIKQNRQVIYSYNVSNGQNDEPSSNALNKAAPTVRLTVNTSERVGFKSVSLTNNEMDLTSINATYNIYYTLVNNSLQTPSYALNEDYTVNGYNLDFYIDSGATFNYVINTDTSTISDTLANSVNTLNNQFNTNYDTLYKVVVNKETAVDFTKYYWSSKSTYYDPTESTGVALTSENMTTKATNAIKSTFNTSSGEYIVSNKAQEIWVQYVSTVVVNFYNIMYKSGISVPVDVAKQLTNNKFSKSFTVWDADTRFGDYKVVNSSIQPFDTPNGEVVIRITLHNAPVNGLGDGQYLFKYALDGMQDGYGRDFTKIICKPDSSGNYARCISFDLGSDSLVVSNIPSLYYGANNYYTRLFGTTVSGTSNNNLYGVAISNSYNYTSCGDAGSDTNGFKIYTVDDLRNIDYYYKNNGYSCKGVSFDRQVELEQFRFNSIYDSENGIWIYEENNDFDNYYDGAHFVLCSDIDLQGDFSRQMPSGTAYMSVKSKDDLPNLLSTWVALCIDYYGSSLDNLEKNGFDGYLDGETITGEENSRKKVYGLYSNGDNNTSDANQNYGIFARIIGGTVMNTKIANSFIVAEGGLINAGLLVGYAKDATFNDLLFTNIASTYGAVYYYNDQIIPFVQLSNGLLKGGTFQTVHGSVDNAGLLGGELVNCSINTVEFNLNEYKVYLEGNYAGILSGLFSGHAANITVTGSPSDISITGNGSVIVTATYSGGVFGAINNNGVTENNETTIIDQTTIQRIGLYIGDYTTTLAGGLAATMRNAKITNTLFNPNNGDNGYVKGFFYSEDDATTRKINTGVYLMAKSVITSTETFDTGKGGIIGGLIGLMNSGEIDNLHEGTYKSYTGIINTSGSVVGGVVGYLAGGTVKNVYSNLLIQDLVTNAKNVSNYWVGGIAGYVASRAIVDGCYVVKSMAASSSSISSYLDGSIYVFYDYERASFAYGTQSNLMQIRNTTSGGKVEDYNGSTVYYKCNLFAGGIAGYTQGAIINSVVKNTKITINVYSNAVDTASSLKSVTMFTNGQAGNGGFGYQVGLITGKYAPKFITGARLISTSLGSISMISSNYEVGDVTELEKFSDYMEDLTLEDAIIGCSAISAGVIFIGSMYVDTAPATMLGVGTKYPVCISFGGIVGSTELPATDDLQVYTALIQNAKIANNYFAYQVQAKGATNYQPAENNPNGHMDTDLGYT
ncbi:MAG: bacterial Ig-like domain-containing protein, partial [Clostridia bacterium]|nr:bacterial Ig-like domain-containing protein [Clostridia bacterium]